MESAISFESYSEIEDYNSVNEGALLSFLPRFNSLSNEYPELRKHTNTIRKAEEFIGRDTKTGNSGAAEALTLYREICGVALDVCTVVGAGAMTFPLSQVRRSLH